MTEKEMFEKSFERPRNYFKLSEREQYKIDEKLGILDWKGNGLLVSDMLRYQNYYKIKK